MLLPDDIVARLQRVVVRARGGIVVSTWIITPLAASAQIVVPDVKRWSEEQCVWLHRHALEACKRTDPQQECSGKMAEETSMAINRGLSALDAFWRVRDREEFE